MIAIKNATLVMRDHLIPDAVLFIENGLIADFGEMRTTPIPENCEVIDAQGLFVGPGLVDIHAHNGGKAAFYEEPKEAAQYHLKGGTTTILPALYFKFNKDQYIEYIGVLRDAMKDPDCCNIAGLYMEGMYMNPKFGANREKNPWKGPICREDYMPVIEAAGDLPRVWVTAPERL